MTSFASPEESEKMQATRKVISCQKKGSTERKVERRGKVVVYLHGKYRSGRWEGRPKALANKEGPSVWGFLEGESVWGGKMRKGAGGGLEIGHL